MKRIFLNEKPDLADLKAGDRVLLCGRLLTARDAAHERLFKLWQKGEKLPYEFVNSYIYYAGPSETPPNKVIGSLGPTTSVRMDKYASLMEIGVKGIIGKGERSGEAKAILNRLKVVYFVATGGCGALLSKSVKSCKIVAFDELGCEAIRELVVQDFPATVAYDLNGGDIFI